MKQATKYLIEAITLDLLPSELIAYVDFGIDPVIPNPQYGALHWGLRHDTFTIEELNDACGDGKKLTELANRTWEGRQNPYACTIRTAWDVLNEYDFDDSDHLDATFKN